MEDALKTTRLVHRTFLVICLTVVGVALAGEPPDYAHLTSKLDYLERLCALTPDSRLGEFGATLKVKATNDFDRTCYDYWASFINECSKHAELRLIPELTYREVKSVFADLSQKPPPEPTLGFVPIPVRKLGDFALLAAAIYLLTHLWHLRSISSKMTEEMKVFAWIPLFKGWLSQLVFHVSTTGIAALAVVLRLFTPGWSQGFVQLQRVGPTTIGVNAATVFVTIIISANVVVWRRQLGLSSKSRIKSSKGK